MVKPTRVKKYAEILRVLHHHFATAQVQELLRKWAAAKEAPGKPKVLPPDRLGNGTGCHYSGFFFKVAGAMSELHPLYNTMDFDQDVVENCELSSIW